MGNSIYAGGFAAGNFSLEGPIPAGRSTSTAHYQSPDDRSDVDQVIVRLTQGGTPTRVSHIDGSRSCCSRVDAIRSIAAVHDGTDRKLVVGGYFRGTLSFPGLATTLTNSKTNSRGYDGFIAVLDAWTGNFLWATHVGTGPNGVGGSSGMNQTIYGQVSSTPNRDSCNLYSVTSDAAGNVYAAGDLCDATDGDGAMIIGSDGDPGRVCKGLLVKFNGQTGAMMWQRAYQATDDYYGVSVDLVDHSVFVGGASTPDSTPHPTPHPTSPLALPPATSPPHRMLISPAARISQAASAAPT